MKDKLAEKVMELYGKGVKQNVIAETLNLSKDQVWRIIHKKEPKRRIIHKTRKAKIAEKVMGLYEEGVKQNVIAQQLNLSTTKVWRIIHKKRKDKIAKKVMGLYEEGVKPNVIAQQLNLSTEKVWRIIHEEAPKPKDGKICIEDNSDTSADDFQVIHPRPQETFRIRFLRMILPGRNWIANLCRRIASK